MRKKSVLAVLGVVLTLVSGCSKTPAGVLKGMNEYRKNKEISADVKFKSIESLKKERIDKCKVNDGNLILPTKVCLDSIQNVYLLEGTYIELDDKELVMKRLGLSNNDKWQEEEEETYKIYINESIPNTYVGFTSRGDLSFAHNTNEDWIDDKKKDDVLYGKKDISQSNEAMYQDAEKMFESIKFTDSFTLKPERIRYYKAGKKELKQYCWLLDYKGLPLSNYFVTDKKGTNFSLVNSYKALYYQDGSIKLIALVNPFKIEKENQQKKVVSLQSAVNLVSKKLSGFGKVKISEIRPEYAVYKKYGKNTKVKARPVYTFRVRTTEKNEKEEFAYFSIRVDMITGKITDNLGVNGLKIAK